MKFSTLILIVFVSGCAAYDPATGQRMTPSQGFDLVGRSLLTPPGVSLFENIERNKRAMGYVSIPSAPNGWTYGGNQTIVEVCAGVSRDYWYRDNYVGWYDSNGVFWTQQVRVSTISVAAGYEARVHIESGLSQNASRSYRRY